MKLRVPVLASLAALVVLSAPSIAAAQVESTRQTDDGSIYKFKDDPLDAAGASATGWVLKVRPHIGRTTLIRPRCSFVMEMFKSVEKL